MLLELPCELRDLIIDEVLLNSSTTISELSPYTRFMNPGDRVSSPPFHNALLHTSSQLRTEALQRASALGSTIPTVLDILTLRNGNLKWTWQSRPLGPLSSWGKIETMTVQVRVKPVKCKSSTVRRNPLAGPCAIEIISPITLYVSLINTLSYILYAGSKTPVNCIRRLNINLLHANYDRRASLRRDNSWWVPSKDLSDVVRTLCIKFDYLAGHGCPIVTHVGSIGLYSVEKRKEEDMLLERLWVIADRRRAVPAVRRKRMELGW